MRTAWVFAGASLFVMLVVDICCIPVKNGFNPNGYDGAPSKGVATLSHQPAPQLEPTFPQPAAPVGSSASEPISSVYGSSSMKAYPAHPEAAFPPATQDIKWALAPPSPLSEVEEVPVGSSVTEYVSPPLPPPEPVYQAGELSHYEELFEDGDSQMETEEQGFLPPPPPMSGPVSQSFTSQPQPAFRMNGWGAYPYYDFMFLTGSYPPGTVTHSSSSYEQGTDNWHDAHYVRDYAPYNPSPVQQIEIFPGGAEWPHVKGPAVAGYEQGDVQAALPAHHGHFVQPYQFEEQTPRQAGHNLGEDGY